MWSCSDLTEMNVDPKRPTTTKSEYLFTNAQKRVVDQMVSTNVNNNVFRLFVQQWTETTYPDESQYNLTGRKIPDTHFTVLYRDVLRDFQEAKTKILAETTVGASEAAIKANKLAVIDVMMCYTFSVLVDTFGDVPYAEALDIVKYPQPKYDDAKSIYTDIMAKLKADAIILKTNSADVNFGAADIIYGGTAASNAKWAKFANSLIIKMAVNLANTGIAADITVATTAATDALASGPLASNADNTKLVYLTTTGNTNPLYLDLVTSKRDDFVPADTFVKSMDLVVTGGDPRMGKYFTKTGGVSPPVLPLGRTYIGGIYGEKNKFSSYDHITSSLNSQVFPGTIFDFSELQFLLAEAAEKGLVAGGASAAKTYYEAGISASFTDWGLTDAQATTYATQPNVLYTNPATTYKEKIGMQSWYALFNRGFEAWTSYRRLDFPKLIAPQTAINNNILNVPVRYFYSGVEGALNPTNYDAAATAIGGDKMETRIFWDKN